MSNAKLLSQEEDKKVASYLFQNTDSTGLANAVGSFFNAEGYKLEEGTPEEGIYGKGSGALRALFGGWAKRFKFKVKISPESGKVRLKISKAMSGAVGGIMGHSEMNREFARLKKKVQSLSL
jgi:hypothetical protein